MSTWVSTDIRRTRTVAKGPSVVTGLVLDGDGNQIGHLDKLLGEASGERERLMRTLKPKPIRDGD